MKNVVCKFGGTSMADVAALRRVKKIVEADTDRRLIVVSAPGKRFERDVKITDLLFFATRDTGDKSVATFQSAYGEVSSRFLSLAKGLNLSERFIRELSEELFETGRKIQEERDLDFAASRGEYFAAKIVARYLRVVFFDAKDVIFFSKDGGIEESSFSAIRAALHRGKRVVLPGFYGKGADGKIKTFSRGGGDVTGAIAASAVRACLFEKWTDVSGVFSADPHLYRGGKRIPFLTYDQLSGSEALCGKVLHPLAAEILKKARISVRISNTFDRLSRGTLIVPCL